MPRASKKHRVRQAKATTATLNRVRVEQAQRECQRAEKARDAAHRAVTAAYIELGRALLVGEMGDAE